MSAYLYRCIRRCRAAAVGGGCVAEVCVVGRSSRRRRAPKGPTRGPVAELFPGAGVVAGSWDGSWLEGADRGRPVGDEGRGVDEDRRRARR